MSAHPSKALLWDLVGVLHWVRIPSRPCWGPVSVLQWLFVPPRPFGGALAVCCTGHVFHQDPAVGLRQSAALGVRPTKAPALGLRQCLQRLFVLPRLLRWGLGTVLQWARVPPRPCGGAQAARCSGRKPCLWRGGGGWAGLLWGGGWRG